MSGPYDPGDPGDVDPQGVDPWDDASPGRHRRNVRVDATSQVPVLPEDYVPRANPQDFVDTDEPDTPEGREAERSSVLASSAIMAAGTLFSRFSGYLRTTLLAAALGLGLHADAFNIANTIPNMMYILVAGGIFNAVLVPQLVRAMKEDPDRGDGYTARIITLAALFLGAITILLVAAAPWVMDIYLSSKWRDPAVEPFRESVIVLARYCLPQVFFYGMFVLVGQVLNARGRFGPMMWAPIANNVISVLVLVGYLVVYGPVSEAVPFTADQEALLGIGATVGIAAQFLILVPFLRAAGVRYRPRFDFRNAGLGHTLRLGVWTVLFVIVNQIAYTFVVRLASSGTASGQLAGEQGTGYTVYSSTFLIVMVPHAIITVSLATSILPRLSSYAADRQLTDLGRLLSGTLRTALAVVVPFAALLPMIAKYIANVIWGWGAAADHYDLYVLTLLFFGPGLIFFTVHYMMLRGYYALEQTRTVFLIQCAVAATNIAAALALVHRVEGAMTAPALALAYNASYIVGAVISMTVLRRQLAGRSWAMAGYTLRLLVSTLAAAGITWLFTITVHALVPDETGKVLAIACGGSITLVMVLTFLLAAKAFGLTEVTSLVELVTRRLRRRRS